MVTLGERVGLSQSQTWRRIERLEQDGYILRRVAVLDREKLGLNVQLFAQVKLNRHGERAAEKFRTAVDQFVEVIEVHTLLGSSDFLLRIVTTDLNAYGRFLEDKLSRLPMIQEVNTMISLASETVTRGLPHALVT
jgi:Lrp/AsnC family transcriptional regulator